MNEKVKEPAKKQPTKASCALAIDAGFGMIKFTRREGGQTICDAFPSIAIPAETTSSTAFAEEAGMIRDTRLVDYQDREYRVGKDIRDGLVANDMGRNLSDGYYDSGVYHALMRGALSYMDEDHISTLVLGLPLNHYQNAERIKSLSEHYTGAIKINKTKTVQIDNVVVRPQPFGGYLYLEKHLDQINEVLAKYPQSGVPQLKSGADIMKLTVLIVDPGEFTLDWLLMKPSGPVMKVSSASSDAGRHRIVRQVHALISAKVGRKLGATLYLDIDESLRNKKPLRIAGMNFNLQDPEFLSAIEQSAEDPVNQLIEGLRGMDDTVDLIAVIGGCPTDIANAIKKLRPTIPLYAMEPGEGQNSSMYANVKGFQFWSSTITKD